MMALVCYPMVIHITNPPGGIYCPAFNCVGQFLKTLFMAVTFSWFDLLASMYVF